MKVLFRLVMCVVYYVIFNWFMTLPSDHPPTPSEIQYANQYGNAIDHALWIAFWIHIGLKLLFIVIQDVSWQTHALKFIIEIPLIWIFAPQAILFVIVAAIFIPVGFAWSNLTLASHLATGQGPLEVRRALGRAVSGRSSNRWTP